ncbi:hypothetical protein ACOYW6_11680 [Parablastomonas sp. CN1-191]|uniref:hypothetical protein n=1 Tax=Parablastomonas sp. CN1-191 TaxID=3400908 RepID=UPI003BF8E641
MRIEGDYKKNGFATLRGLVPPEVADLLFRQIGIDLEAAGKSFATFAKEHPLCRQPTIDISGHFYRPLTTFLWGLTPIVSELTGADLLPSYDYFRIYHEGDICRVHSDRPSCEHSVSLTLAYSDQKAWPLEVGSVPVEGEDPCVDDFGAEPYTSVAMQPGDAVLYRGIDLRHGRTQPNPNRWSAHLFLFWVERGGPFSQHAFDEDRLRAELARVGPVPG